MNQSEAKNKERVLEAFDTLFNRRDYAEAERYWSPNYIQHSAHIPPSRDGLFNLTKAAPPSLRYEPGQILAGGDYVIVHGPILQHRTASELDRRGHRSSGGWNSRRALGCHSGRSNT
jgi:predicted SnoaL-like aldol condensation-catalyzing enzyme